MEDVVLICMLCECACQRCGAVRSSDAKGLQGSARVALHDKTTAVIMSIWSLVSSTCAFLFHCVKCKNLRTLFQTV